jgi:23S rRNA pseudouridine1911/1915/1917 synthase
MRTKFLPFEVVYEDRDLIVIDKPAGLLTTHTHLETRAARSAQLTAENLLTDYVRKGQARSSKRVWLVHRLDRETSGVMMFAKDERFAEAIRAKWNELTEKTYLARVEGVLEEEKGVFESWLKEDADGYRVRSVFQRRIPSEGFGEISPRHLGGQTPQNGAKFARTEWKRLSSDGKTTLVEVALKSGRKNQIRVHFSEAGHPVVGDVKYGAKKADRLHLRSIRLVFTHPFTNRRLLFEVPVAADGERPKKGRKT